MLSLSIATLASSFSADFQTYPKILDTALQAVLHQGPKYLVAIGILAATKWAVKRGVQFIGHLIESLEDTLQKFLLQALNAGLWAVGGLTALSVAGLDTTSLITAVGALGVGLSFSLQSSLSQLAAGFLLVVLRPFQVGDTLESGGVRGKVDSIGLFSTTILTGDQTKIGLPNNTLIGGTLKTQGADENYCLEVKVNIGDRPIQSTRARFLDIASALPEVAIEPAPVCLVSTIRPNLTTTLVLKVWCPNHNQEEVRSTLLQRIQEMFQQDAQNAQNAQNAQDELVGQSVDNS
jgi:small conductance mechanosensitive channel